MTDHVQLFDKRRAELEQLISAHLENGSLDEGNAAAFDWLIDAWLYDELMLIAQAHDDEAAAEVDAAQRRAAAEVAVAEARRATAQRAAAAHTERHAVLVEEQRARRAALDARHERRDAHVRVTGQRLDVAAEQFDTARRLLLGTYVVDLSTPGVTAEALNGNKPAHENGRTNGRGL